MQVEPETGQTSCIQVEPDTGQTAYATSSMVAHWEDSVRPAGPAVDSTRPTGIAVARQQEGNSARPAGHAVVSQPGEDNGRQKRRQRSPPDTAAGKTIDASARSTSGRATVQPEEEKITVREELSLLQLIPEADLQSPAITERQQECRIAVVEPEPRRKSSATEISAQEQTVANKPEVAEPHQRLIVSERTELGN